MNHFLTGARSGAIWCNPVMPVAGLARHRPGRPAAWRISSIRPQPWFFRLIVFFSANSFFLTSQKNASHIQPWDVEASSAWFDVWDHGITMICCEHLNIWCMNLVTTCWHWEMKEAPSCVETTCVNHIPRGRSHARRVGVSGRSCNQLNIRKNSKNTLWKQLFLRFPQP